MLLLGRSPHQLPFNPSAYELFIAYREFLEAGLCKRVNLTFNILMLNKSEPSSYQKIHSPKVLIIKKEEILHYNKWLTDQIQKYLKKLDSKLEDLFTPYISFKNMGLLFGLTQNYLREQRYTKNSKNIISKSVLEEMKVSLSQKINDFIIKNPSLREILEHVNLDLLQIIENYENVLKPLPKPHYQMFKHHPEFNRNYFAEIITPEQAYWLGFLFADGYIALEHKKSGDYFRMGIGLSEKEKDLLNKFCKAIGLNPKFISTSMEYCSYTDKRTPIVRIRWGDQQMAMNLMDLGLNYEFNKMKGRRAKIPKLPLLKNKKLMLSFLLGYYDGDGSLGLTTFRNLPRVLPSIISSDYTFLLEIKVYFNIKYKIYNHSYEKYDFKQKKVVKTEGYKLLLGIDLFREMLISFRDSLKRKRVSIDFLDNQSTTSQRLWLRKILRKDKLEQMAQFLSAHKIGKLLGIDHRTLISFADEDYGFKFESGGYYASINNSIRWHGNDSPYYENMVKWKNYLKKLGKFLIE